MAKFLPVLTSPNRRAALGSQPWLRLAIIVGVFLGSIFFALRASRLGDPTLIFRSPLLLILPGALFVLLMLRWPQPGLVLMVAATLAIPFAVGTGTQSRLNAGVLMVILLLGLWIFSMLVERRRIRLEPSRANLPLIIFFVVTILAFAIGQLSWFYFAHKAPLQAQLGGLAMLLLAGGSFLLVGNQLRDFRWLKWMTFVFLALGTFHILSEIIPGDDVFDKVIQNGVYNNSIFWIWLLSMAFSQAFFNRKLPVIWRSMLIGLVLATLYVAFGKDSGWTSGWLPPIISVAVILFVSASPLSWVSIAGGVILVIIKWQSIQNLLFSGDNQYSLTTRLAAWQILAKIIQVSPLIGFGPSNYYWYTQLFPILGYDVVFNSHNNYIDIIAEVGLIGLFCFFWFMGEVWRMGWHLRTRVPEGFAQAYVYGALGGLVGTLVAGMFGDWIIPFTYNIGLEGFRGSVIAWIFLGGLLAIAQMVRRRGDQWQEE
ncbi:MAG TPA: O-antigen ligase family protein [Anaerolineales bacterium]